MESVEKSLKESTDNKPETIADYENQGYTHAEFIVVLKVYAIEDDLENPWSDEELATALFHSPVRLSNDGWSFDANVINLVRADHRGTEE